MKIIPQCHKVEHEQNWKLSELLKAVKKMENYENLVERVINLREKSRNFAVNVTES